MKKFDRRVSFFLNYRIEVTGYAGKKGQET